MNRDLLLGVIITAVSLSVVTFLVFWSRWTINWIARKGVETARQIIKEKGNGR